MGILRIVWNFGSRGFGSKWTISVGVRTFWTSGTLGCFWPEITGSKILSVFRKSPNLPRNGLCLFFCLLWMIRYNVVSAMHFQIEMYSLCISLKLKVNKLHRVMESENGLYMRFKQFHSTLVYLTKVMCVFWCVALIFISVSPHKRCNLCTCQ